jgi:hypothetical protein
VPLGLPVEGGERHQSLGERVPDHLLLVERIKKAVEETEQELQYGNLFVVEIQCVWYFQRLWEEQRV